MDDPTLIGPDGFTRLTEISPTARSDHVTAAWIAATVDGSTYHDTAEEAERVAAELVSRVRAERLASGSRIAVREPVVYRIEVEGEGDAA